MGDLTGTGADGERGATWIVEYKSPLNQESLSNKNEQFLFDYGPEEIKLFEGIAWGSGPIGYRAMMLITLWTGQTKQAMKRSQFYSFKMYIAQVK